MENALYFLQPLDFSGAQDAYDPLQGHGVEGVNKGKQTHMFGTEDWGDIDYLCSEYSFYQDNSPQKGILLSKDHHQLRQQQQLQQQQQQPFSDFRMMMEDFQFDIATPPIQLLHESSNLNSVLTEISDHVQPKKENPYPSSFASLELLNNFKTGVKRMNGEKLNVHVSETSTTVDCQRLSTEEVMRVAGARYIQFSTQTYYDLSMLSHPFGCALSGLTDEETKDVELAQLLIASAEKVGNQQFDRASKLLTQCDYLSSSIGNPVQRVVYYFAEALRERINRETGRVPLKGLDAGQHLLDLEEAFMNPNPAHIACLMALPFCQVFHFAGVQAILEGVASAKKVHSIDFGIRTGIQWTILMQALVARHGCPLELFKLTVVGTNQGTIEETGKRLESFAKSMNIPFSFKTVIISDMKDLKEELFDLEDDEAIAIYCPFILMTMLSQSDGLESLMRVIRNFNPCIMVVVEVEANHNSPSFVTRFIETLFFHSAFFDCFEDCMDRNNQNRMTTERKYLGVAILNIVATEGEARTIRHVGIDVWRAFFARFRMVETELSHSSKYQASLVVKQFSCGSSCTLDMNGKSLIIGWKGTPVQSLSVWKFH